MGQNRDHDLSPVPNRRGFLRAGAGCLTLADLLALRAQADTVQPLQRERTALIIVWLQGGASHLETYDPKPDAPSEVRGPYGAISTNVPGVHVSELLPMHAAVADKFSLLRSLAHTGICHQQGNQQMFTGHPEQILKLRPEHPDMFCVANQVRTERGSERALPAYVGVNPIPYLGSSYMGPGWEPFVVGGDPNLPEFVVPGLGGGHLPDSGPLGDRMGLVRRLDSVCELFDDPVRGLAFDSFRERAFRMLTGPEARRAFDLSLEDPRIRDRYGRNTWGQRCLMARRLVEAGVDLVTTSLDGPLCGRVGNWDDHAVNHHIFDDMKLRCQVFDRAVSALIEDIHARNLDRRVMVVVTGEFGRTPKISYEADSTSGVKQPGRDHWPHAVSLLLSGGGITPGQVVGSTDRTGAEVRSRKVGVRDLMATLYHHLGIDAARLTLTDRTGRPVPVLPTGQPIAELIGS